MYSNSKIKTIKQPTSAIMSTNLEWPCEPSLTTQTSENYNCTESVQRIGDPCCYPMVPMQVSKKQQSCSMNAGNSWDCSGERMGIDFMVQELVELVSKMQQICDQWQKELLKKDIGLLKSHINGCQKVLFNMRRAKSLKNQQEVSPPIVLVYEIPIEMEIKQNTKGIEELIQQNSILRVQLEKLRLQFEEKPTQVVNNIYELPIEMYLQKQSQMRQTNWVQNCGPVNFSFNCNSTQTIKKQNQQQQKEMEIPANRIYQIPIQMIIQKDEEQLECCDIQCQTYNITPLMSSISKVVEFCNIEAIRSEEEQLSRRKNKQISKKQRNTEKQQMELIRQESLSLITKQMQQLLQSEEFSEKSTKQRQQINGQGNYQITYKSQTQNNNVQCVKISKTDDFSRESLLFTELGNIISPCTLNPVAVNCNHFLSPFSSTGQSHRLPHDQEEQNVGNDEHSNSIDPSLINGISMIKKRQEHSQSQSNSHINDYLQAYQKYENCNIQNNESYESKNNANNCDGMNDCNHCGVSVKKSPNEIKGFCNRSLGANTGSGVGYYTSKVENVIEERYSQQSRSKRTTLKNVNIGMGNANDHVIENEDDFMNFDHRPRNQRARKMLRGGQRQTQNAIRVEERYLQLGENLFLQKSLIIQSNKAEQADKKKAKQRLSQHPYLNFYQTSEVDQPSQSKNDIKQNSNVLQDILKDQKNKIVEQNIKSSFEQTSILLNFNVIECLPNQSKQSFKLHEIGIIQASGQVNKNQHLRGLTNGKNQVYLIDGDTSSQGSRANREMRISQMKNSKVESSGAKNLNLTPPNYAKFKQNVVDAGQFFDLKEKSVHLEQQKASLIHKLSQSQSKVQFLKKQLIGQQQSLSSLEVNYKEKLINLLGQLDSYDEKLQSLEKQLEEKTNKIEQEIKKNEQKERKMEQNDRTIKKYEKEIRQLNQNIKMIENSLDLNIKKLTKQNQQKDQIIQYLRSENGHLKDELQFQTRALKQQLTQRQQKIDIYCKQIEKNHENIQHLKSEYTEIMNSLEAACREKQLYMLQANSVEERISKWDKLQNIFESQFSKCKEQHAREIQARDRKIAQLQMENFRNNQGLKQKDLAVRRMSDIIERKEINIAELEEEVRKSKTFKLTSEIQEQLNYLRKQVVNYAQQIVEKDEIINRLEENLKSIEDKIEEYEDQMEMKLRTPRNKPDTNQSNKRESICKNLNFNTPNQLTNMKESYHGLQNGLPFNLYTAQSIISPTDSFIPSNSNVNAAELKEKQQKILALTVTIKSFEQNIVELQGIILNYEQLLLQNQDTIKELQDQVSEYLEDAIEKELQNESLIRDVEDYEAEINQILREKIGVEIENKRMKKMIAASEKRISAIGTRLIHAAKDKIKNKDEISTIPISQNSTLKLRQLRLQ